MSTRCNVKVVFDDDRSKLFYNHHDGYPAGVGKELVDIVDSNLTPPSSLNDFVEFCTLLAESGYEEVFTEAGDAEWYYEVTMSDCNIHCYKVDWRTGAKVLIHEDLAATGDFD
jgi:hypothetical protein